MEHKPFNIRLYRLISRNTIPVIFALVTLVLFLLLYITSRQIVEDKAFAHYLPVDVNTFQPYDPYYERKIYLPIPEKIGYEISNGSNTRYKYMETILSSPNSQYKFSFYSGRLKVDELSIYTYSGKDVTELPASVVEHGFTRVRVTPVRGSYFYISYINFLEVYEDNMLLKEYPPRVGSAIELTKTTGDPHNITGIIAYIDDYTDRTLKLSVGNIGALPVELVSISNGRSRLTFAAGTTLQPVEDNPGELQPFTFEGVDPAFTADPQALTLTYRYTDDGIERTAPVYPFKRRYDEIFNGTLIRETDTTADFPFVTIGDNEITFDGTTFQIDKPLILPKGKTVLIQPGQTIDLSDGAFILSYSPLSAVGTEAEPITIQSSDGSGQGLVVIKPGGKSHLAHVIFDNLSNPNSGIWFLTGAVTFYEADVEITHTSFRNNRCEDALHVMRSEFFVDNSLFSNTFADAFDSDFSQGRITNSAFEHTGNDGLDFSTSTVTAEDIQFTDIGDKGVSTGENSTLALKNITVNRAVIGITSKDFSTITGDLIEVSNVEIGFALYQKKPEFGPAKIDLTGTKIYGSIGLDYLIQDGSELRLNDQLIIPRAKKKEAVILDKLIAGEKIQW